MKNTQIVNLRVIAIIFVVIGHSIIIFDPRWGVYKAMYDSKPLYIGKEIINTFQMQLFFSISGYLFYYSSLKQNQLRGFIIDKTKRLLIPFFIVGLLYLIPIRLIADYPLYKTGYGDAVYRFFSKMDNGHLWYLPTLFGIFVLFRCLLPLLSKKKFEIAIFIFLAFLSFLSNKIPGLLHINLIAKWSVFFYTGFVINRNYNYLKDRIPRGLWLCILFSVPLILIARFNVDYPVVDSIIRFIFSILVIFSAYYFVPNKTGRLISYLDRNSYGIYLFHAPIVYVMFHNFYDQNPFILVLGTFIAAFFGALLITELVRKLRLNFIIGEFK